MAAFQAVNTNLSVEPQPPQTQDATTPTTPRPANMSSTSPNEVSPAHDESSPNTPTRDSFGGVTGQRPLPSSSTIASPPAQQSEAGLDNSNGLSRGDSLRSTQSNEDADQDVDMDESDGGSDEESVADENGRPSKKKKGQRFFCTDFPPCTLSFTRSEHLARHIRKHTGERPFQCHCARRFSRLDNLRQHAQTVHVNEDIPTDSLAATGTRFQRQVRTDRVRPAGNRSRASTMGSQTSHSRGHSRNLSSSSIGSTASSISGIREEIRRRPPPLIMAGDPSRTRMALEKFRSPPDSPGSRDLHSRYSANSPSGFSTPTSATFSNGPGSPRFPSALQSPSSSHVRPASMWAGGTSARRLSVPSGTNPFQSPQGTGPVPPYFSPLQSSNASAYSGQSSAFASPTSSVFSTNREYASRAAQDAEFKRRTWHPETRTTMTGPHGMNSMAYYANVHRPTFQHSTSSGLGTRLPGIESFDHAQSPQIHNPPSTPPRRQPSPMQVDTPSRPPLFGSDRTSSGPDDRRGVADWDMSLHRNLTRLDITSTPPREASFGWPHSQNAQPTYKDPMVHQHVAQPQQASEVFSQEIPQMPARATAPCETKSQPPETPRSSKRHGWYNGPLKSTHSTAQRTSPEDSSSSEGVPTPSTSSIGEYNPSIVHSNGWVESNSGVAATEGQPQYATGNEHAAPSTLPATQAEVSKPEGGMLNRLEALVAVATSESATAEKPF